MKKLMMLAAMLAVAMIAVAPALAQDDPAVVADAKAKTAKAGGAKAEAECKDGYHRVEGRWRGGQGPVRAAPAAPAAEGRPGPAAAPGSGSAAAPGPGSAKELPKTGGSGTASLFALGAGALLVAGGLVARRIVK